MVQQGRNKINYPGDGRKENWTILVKSEPTLSPMIIKIYWAIKTKKIWQSYKLNICYRSYFSFQLAASSRSWDNSKATVNLEIMIN